MMKKAIIYLSILLAILASSCGENSAGDFQDICIAPKNSFAYITRTGETISQTASEIILPPKPWQAEASLPEFADNAIEHRKRDWLLAVRVNPDGHRDIWVLRSWTDEIISSDYKYTEILIYNTKTQKWKTISAQVKNSQATIGEIFITNNGSVWAHNYWGDFFTVFEPPLRVGISNYNNSTPSSMSILSKYNEKSGQFKFVDDVKNIPVGDTFDEWNKAFLDNNGVFWFFIQKDGIYSYNVSSHSVKRHADLSVSPDKEFLVKSATFATDGSIFFSDDFSTIFHFSPETNEMTRIGGTPLPFQNKYNLYFHNILVDHAGRLWFGDVGWSEPDTYTIWYQLVQSPIFITNKTESDTRYFWERPSLILESSDGLLWYKSENGMVWLDPQKEKWCWFTTEPSNIISDTKNVLWIIADNEIYSRIP
jgi:streptogramin lyase